MFVKHTMDEKFKKINKEFIDKFLQRNPLFASALGLHEPYDYLLPPGHKEHLEENLKMFEEWISKLKRKITYDKLSGKHKIDWKVIETTLELEKFYFYDYPTYETNPDGLLGINYSLFEIITRDYASLNKRGKAIASRIEKLPKFLQEFRTRFEKTRPVKLWTEIAIETAEKTPGFFKFLLHSTKDRVSEKVYTKLENACKKAEPKLKTHIEWLKSLFDKAKEDWALGEEKFSKLIKLRKLGMTPEEIYELGKQYLKELKEERESIAYQIAPGKNADEVLDMIEKYVPQTFEETMKMIEDEINKAKEFIVENNITAIHEEDKLLVRETPDFMAPLIPFAALSPPSKFDKPQIGTYLVTRPKDISNLGKHWNYSSIINTSLHEAYPGHFLQLSMTNRGPIERMLLQAIETIEGWAHYCEHMMMEHGYSTDPKVKFIQVNDGIWRAVRVVVDVKLSQGKMSFDEAVKMLMQEAKLSEEGAKAEAKRYTMSPGYQLSYLLGKHLILKLREEVKNKMGGKWSEKFFHDTITENGCLPIWLLREMFDVILEKNNF